MDAVDVPRKVVCEKARIHPSTMSRKINALDTFQQEEILAIGVAIGLHMRNHAGGQAYAGRQ